MATTTFDYGGEGTQTFTAPANGTAVVTVQGAAGGGSDGGVGGVVEFTLSMTSGQELTIYVGGQGSAADGNEGGAGGWGYGSGGTGGTEDISGGIGGDGGGGASAVLDGSTLLAVAGGGGGAGAGASSPSGDGGAGGDPSGANGGYGGGGAGGYGATQSGPGTGGTDAGSGSGVNGGNGASADNIPGGGGGGAGYFGGGGGTFGGSTSPYCGAGGGGGSSWAGNGVTSISYSTAGSAANGVVTVVFTITDSAPDAPTLLSPSNGAYLDTSSGVTFEAQYNSTDGANQNAFGFRIKNGSGSYQYWTGTALSSTEAWVSCNVSPGGTFSVTLPGSALGNGDTFYWNFQSQEANDNLQGPWANSDSVLVGQAAPTLVVTGPTGTISTTTLSVTWTTTPANGASQATYRVVIYTTAQASVSGFTPGESAATYDTGVVTSNSAAIAVGPFTGGVTYYAYVQVTETGSGQASSWEYTTFTIEQEAPNAPVVTAQGGVDANNVPAMIVTVEGQNNLLSFDDSEFGNDAVMLADVSGNGQALEVGGGTVTSVASPSGSAFANAAELGAASWLQSPAGDTVSQGAITGNGWTLEFLLTPTTADLDNSAVIVARQYVKDEWYVSLSPSGLYFIYNSSAGTYIDCSSVLTADDTAAIALEWDGSDVYIFVNGSMVASAACTSADLVTPSAENYLTIGWMTVKGGSVIDEVRVSSYARYSSSGYTPATSPFATDDSTACLYPLDAVIAGSYTGDSNTAVSLAYPSVTDGQLPQGAPGYGDHDNCTLLAAAANGSVGATTQEYAVLPNVEYTIQAAFQANGTNFSRFVTVAANWYDPSGTFVSTNTVQGTDVSSEYTIVTGNVTSPDNAAWATITVGVEGCTAYSSSTEYHRVDDVGLTPGTSTPWDRGGLAGQCYIWLQRSDGLYVRNAGYTTADTTPTPGVNTVTVPADDFVTIYDYEAVPGLSYTYSAVLSTVQNGDTLSVTADSSAGTLTVNSYWFIEPLNPSASLQLGVTSQPTVQGARVAVHTPISPVGVVSLPTVVSGGISGQDGSLTVETKSYAEWSALKSSVQSGTVKWLMSPYSDGLYASASGAANANSSSGSTGSSHTTQSPQGPATTPVRSSVVTYVEVGRP